MSTYPPFDSATPHSCSYQIICLFVCIDTPEQVSNSIFHVLILPLQLHRRLLLLLRHHLHHLTQLIRFPTKLGLYSDLGAVQVEQDRQGRTREGEERDEGRGPVDAEVVVHLGGEQGERDT
jgi:hypothetical protein